MSKPTFDENSEAYAQYKWIVSVIEPYTDGLSIDTTDEDNENDVETFTTITLEKKISGKSSVVMKTEDSEITINWNGIRLSASIFNEKTQDSDKMEVPDAITRIVDTLKDVFGITINNSSDEDENVDDDSDEINDDLSKDPDDDKPIDENNEIEEDQDVKE